MATCAIESRGRLAFHYTKALPSFVMRFLMFVRFGKPGLSHWTSARMVPLSR